MIRRKKNYPWGEGRGTGPGSSCQNTSGTAHNRWAKKKTKTLVPSDWKTYYGSSVELQKDVEQLGEEAFRRDILAFCTHKGTAGYLEMKYQMDARVLELPDEACYNKIVNARVHKKHIKPAL